MIGNVLEDLKIGDEGENLKKWSSLVLINNNGSSFSLVDKMFYFVVIFDKNIFGFYFDIW